jgi:hypothetical protein
MGVPGFDSGTRLRQGDRTLRQSLETCFTPITGNVNKVDFRVGAPALALV